MAQGGAAAADREDPGPRRGLVQAHRRQPGIAQTEPQGRTVVGLLQRPRGQPLQPLHQRGAQRPLHLGPHQAQGLGVVFVLQHVVPGQGVLQVAALDPHAQPGQPRVVRGRENRGLHQGQPTVVKAHQREQVRRRALILEREVSVGVGRRRRRGEAHHQLGAGLLVRDLERRGQVEGLADGLAVDADLRLGVLAPVAHRLAAAGAQLVVLRARDPLVQGDPGPLQRLVQLQLLVAGVGVEQHPPRLARLPRLQHHQLRLQRENADEAHPELADLGQVRLPDGAEEGQQVVVVDPLVHPLTVIGDGDRHQTLGSGLLLALTLALVLAFALGLGLGLLRRSSLEGEVHVDPGAGRVEAVLHQLAQKGERVGELVDQLGERVVRASPAGPLDQLGGPPAPRWRGALLSLGHGASPPTAATCAARRSRISATRRSKRCSCARCSASCSNWM